MHGSLYFYFCFIYEMEMSFRKQLFPLFHSINDVSEDGSNRFSLSFKMYKKKTLDRSGKSPQRKSLKRKFPIVVVVVVVVVVVCSRKSPPGHTGPCSPALPDSLRQGLPYP